AGRIQHPRLLVQTVREGVIRGLELVERLVDDRAGRPPVDVLELRVRAVVLAAPHRVVRRAGQRGHRVLRAEVAGDRPGDGGAVRAGDERGELVAHTLDAGEARDRRLPR